MTREYAKSRTAPKRNLEAIPEFRNHLARENINMREFERRQATQPPPDMAAEALTLARRRNALHATR